MLSVQLGAALSVSLFPAVGAAGTAWLRLTIGAAIFLAWARPAFRTWSLHELRVPLLLGVVTGLMTLSFLAALERLPLGTTVAIEFLGPLTVAGVRSRSRRALVWPLLALLGVLALTEPWQGSVDVLGLVLAALAGTGWGIYIVLTQHVGDRFGGIDGLAISIPVAAVVTAFFGIPQSLGGLTLGVVALSAVLAVLMPVIPYTFELIALRRLTAASFGTLMAVEPALGVLMGVLILHQVPGPLQVLGVALVVVAGIGAERIGHRDDGPLVLEPPGI
jgi:inner membrane transporter RhtA